MNLTRIKKTMENIRGTLAWVASISVGTILAFIWLQTNFVTNAQGREMMEKTLSADASLAEEVKESNDLLRLHIQKSELKDVLSQIKMNEAQVFQIEQWTATNGKNEQATARLRRLKTEHRALILKRDCIINKNPLCD